MQVPTASNRWLYAWALGSVAAGVASLLVPLYVVQLGGGPVALGVLASTAAVVGAPGAIIVGRFADRTGNRRGILVVASAGLAVTLAAFPFLRSVPVVVLINAVFWLIWASVVPVVTMLVVDNTPQSAWSGRIGRLNAYQGYGWAGGLLVGMVWTIVGANAVSPLLAQRTLFVACTVCALGGLVGLIRFLPADGTHQHTRAETRRIARAVSQSRRNVRSATFVFTPNRLYWTTRAIDPRRLWGRFTPALGVYFVASLLFFAGFAAFWAPLPAFLTDVGYGSGVVFGLFLAASLGSAVLYEPAGRLSDRYDIRYVQSGALGVRAVLFPAVGAVGTVVSAATLGLAVAVLLLTAIGLTWSFIAVAGTAIVTRLASPTLRGEVLGVYTALSAIAGGLGGVAGGVLASVNYALGFAVAGALVLVGAALVFTVRALSEPVATPPTETPQ